MKYATIVLAVVVGCAVAVVPAQQPTVLGNIECTICKLFEPEFAALAKEDKNVVESRLNAICDKIPFGELANGCVAFIDKEIDNIVAALAKDPATVCTQIHACEGAVEQVVEPVVLTNIVECDVCKALEPAFAGLVGKEEPEVKAELDKLCEKVPFVGGECERFVNSKLKEIMQALQSPGGAKTVCVDIRACANFAVKIEQARATVRAQVNKIDPKCLLCHLLGPTLEKLAGKEEPVIQKELDTICERVLGWEHKLAEDCVNYINKEGAMIAKVLAEDNGSGAKELCEKIGWCPSTLVEAKVTNLENPLECDICKAVGPELEKLAGQKEPVVVKDLEIVCSKLSIFKQPCDNWVEKEGAMIAKVLTEDEGSSAHVLCQKLHMCESAVVEVVEQSKSDIKCFICHELGPELEKLAKKEEGVVAKDLEHICDKIPLVGKDCDKFIQKEAAMIAKVLTEDEGSKAHVLCEKIGWC